MLVDRARSTFISAAGRNNLSIDIEPNQPLVKVDRRRIVQVGGNLLSNVVRHSSATSTIWVTAVREDFDVAVSVADEEPVIGARFTFTILSIEAAGGVTARISPALSTRTSWQGVGERVRVLAVDDDPQTLRYVSEALSKAGYTPILTGGPGEALRIVEAENPDLIRLDLGRHRADEHPAGGRPVGHLPVHLRPGRAHRQGLRYGAGGLRRQALLADGTGG